MKKTEEGDEKKGKDKKSDTAVAGIQPISNFIRNIIDEDLAAGKNDGRVMTRFPPEPNGYLHIGHAKSICLNFGLAADYNGLCNLRFDDTNPTKEEVEYVESIKEDVKWLGFDWGNRLYYASDYFDRLYDYAVQLIKKGKAYVCSLSAEEIRKFRGTLNRTGQREPLQEPRHRRESWIFLTGCGKGNSKTERMCFAPKSTCPPPT